MQQGQNCMLYILNWNIVRIFAVFNPKTNSEKKKSTPWEKGSNFNTTSAFIDTSLFYIVFFWGQWDYYSIMLH